MGDNLNVFQIVNFSDIGHLKVFRHARNWWSKTHNGYAYLSSVNGAPIMGRSGGTIKAFDKNLKVGINLIGKK